MFAMFKPEGELMPFLIKIISFYGTEVNQNAMETNGTILRTKEYKRWRSDLQRGARRLTRYSRFCAWAERRRTESFKNTRFYCRFWVLLALAYLLGYFLTRDYYHGWYGVLCTFFDVSVFNGIRADWSLVWKIGKLLLQLGGILLIVFSVITLFKKGIKAKYFEFVYYGQSAGYMENQHSVCCTGPPGAGKTSLGGDMAVCVARRRWEDLKYEYHTRKRRIRTCIQMGMTEELEKFKAIEESYLFFKRRERCYIPCLATTLGMRVCGRYAYKANNKFFLQMQRVPEYCVIFDDESGSTKGANTSSTVNDNVADFYRYVRHYGDFMIIMTEQGDDGAGKYIRKCLDNTIYCKMQKWILKPGFLLRLDNRLRARLIRLEETGKYKPRFNTFVYYFDAIVRTIGYRQISYRNMGNVEHDDGALKGKEGTYILPSRLIYDYDDRSYRFTYKALDLPLELEGWDRLTLRAEDDLRNYSVVRESPRNAENEKAV